MKLFGEIPVHPNEFEKIDPRLKWFGKCLEGKSFCTVCGTLTPEDLSSHHQECCNYKTTEELEQEEDYNKKLYSTAEQRESSLDVRLQNGKLVVSVGLDVLSHAVTMNPEWGKDVSIQDNLLFAKEVVNELLDDTTQEPLVYQMFDKAADRVVENGGLSLAFKENE